MCDCLLVRILIFYVDIRFEYLMILNEQDMYFKKNKFIFKKVYLI